MNREPIVLGIESSCDETGIGIVAGNRLLTNTVSSSMAEHVRFGGVIPEIASRAHLEAMIPALDAALTEADVELGQVDALAVTGGPGLAGALMVGVAAAKALAAATGKPLYAINHLVAHVGVGLLEGQSGAVTGPDGRLPADLGALLVSGGHTEILRVHDIAGDVRLLGATLDDAAGECFDKVARVLGMPYPGGAALDKAAKLGDERKYTLPRSKPGENPYNMSFSGLKTAALNLIHHAEQVGEELDIPSLCAAFSAAVSDTLVPRAVMALKETGYRKIAVAGGVAANSRIRADLLAAAKGLGAEVYMPPLSLCGDNGAMIGAQAYYEFLAGNTADMHLNAYATKSILGEAL